jgi:RimJ/RimL family protein N-acetyltransferase
VLREVIDSDLPVFFRHQRDPTARHMAAFVPADPDDRAAFDAHWRRIRASAGVKVRTIVVDAEVVGHVASFERDGDHEVTYWIDAAHWGRGIATAALRAFLQEDPVRPVVARVVKDSAASRRVLEKCGFLVVGEDHGHAAGRGTVVEELVLRLD